MITLMENNIQLKSALGAASLAIFILMLLTIFLILIFYKKYNKTLSDAYAFLIENGFISDIADNFFSSLGFFGFAHRAIIMSKFISHKPVKIGRNKYLDSQASTLLLSNFEFEWLKWFIKLYKFAMVLVFLMFLAVAIKKNIFIVVSLRLTMIYISIRASMSIFRVVALK